MMRRLSKINSYQWILFAFWALFVNAINIWMIGPLVQDFAIYGVVAVFLIALLWIASIPSSQRFKWIAFTIFCLMLGQGLSTIAFYPLSSRIPLGIVLFLGLFIIGLLVSKYGWRKLLLSSVALVLINLLLPISEWPFLTHFEIVKYGRFSLNPTDIPALPFAPISTAQGNALITVKRVLPTQQELTTLATNAVNSPNALENVLRNDKDEYELVKISMDHGHLSETPATAEDLAKVAPWQLVRSFFPFTTANWTVMNHHVIQYMSPTLPPDSATALSLEPASYGVNMVAVAKYAWQKEDNHWNDMLANLGVLAKQPNLQIQKGHLTGIWQGKPIHVAVHGTIILGTGSFTQVGSQQVLVEGADILQIVDLGSGKIVATYRTDAAHPLPNDIVYGPLTTGGTDAIFVNDVPAYILQAHKNGVIDKIYTAPNASLRFEAVMQFPGDQNPEIITDDPSLIRNSPTRYFTSYTFRNDNLYRNWRVFRTNVVNVTPIQFTNSGPEYIALSIYSTGQYLILKRSFLPVMPISIGLLVICIGIGFGLRYRERRRKLG